MDAKGKRISGGFTLLEMTISAGMMLAGALYIFGTFGGVTASTQNVTTEIDLNGQNKRALTALYNELQATSLSAQDTDGLDSTDPVAVFVAETDTAAPAPKTDCRLVQRTTSSYPDQVGEFWGLGATKEQARERRIDRNMRLRFRKVVGYQFNAVAGTIVPEWSSEVVYEVTAARTLVRRLASGATRIVAHDVDAFDVQPHPDGTVVVTLVTAKPSPDGKGWKRYANSVTVNPKN